MTLGQPRPARVPEPARLPPAVAATAESGSGQWALQLALGWLVQTLTHSSFWVGATLFAIQIPNVLAAPWSGVISDRFERSRVLAVALGSVCVGTLLLPR